MWRKPLIIAGVVVVIVVVGALIYFYFFAKPPTPPPPGTGLPVAGEGTPGAGQTTGGAPIVAPNTPTAVSPRLIKISSGPVALGEAVVSKTASASSSPEITVNYIDRQSGNVFLYSSALKTTTRTSNKTIPGIQSALWLPDASFAFVRYLSGTDSSTINTYGLPSNGVNGFFLSQNLADVAVSPEGILTLTSGVNGSTASLLRPDGTHASQLFTTPLSSLHLSFAGKNQYLIFTKASSLLDGNVYLVDSVGTFSRIFGPRIGLTALASPSGKWVLVSYTVGSTMQMALIDISTNQALSLPVASITEKCVWAQDDSAIYCGVPVDPPSSSYPDDWYQGAVQFSDRIWKIQVSGRYAQLVLDFAKETNDSLDAVALAVDKNNTALVFVNKNDLSLWSYSL